MASATSNRGVRSWVTNVTEMVHKLCLSVWNNISQGLGKTLLLHLPRIGVPILSPVLHAPDRRSGRAELLISETSLDSIASPVYPLYPPHPNYINKLSAIHG
jgi:hypothetical protein